MAESETVIGEFATAKRLVELLEDDGVQLDAAIWIPAEEGQGRLYLVPRERSGGILDRTLRVAHTIARHRDELPDAHELRYSAVNLDDPIVRAVLSSSGASGRVRGVYNNGTYVDTAYIFRRAA